MSQARTKISSAMFFIAVMALGLMPGGLKAQDFCCFGDVTMGADFLYWTPCIGDMHYALEANGDIGNINDFDEVKTKYLDPDWDAGIRVYIEADDVFCGFGAAFIYTYYDIDDCDSIETDEDEGITLSTSNPFLFLNGPKATIDWELKFQSADFLMTYPLTVSSNCCLNTTAFSGIKWLRYCEDRKDKVFFEDEVQILKRDLDVWGIGPVIGIKSNYTWCDCLSLFSAFSTSLIVAESETKDHFTDSDGSPEEWELKNCDHCACFPGMHFMAGISYDMCVCDMELTFNIGWEYLSWFNAPSSPNYDDFPTNGKRTASSERNLTFQGAFAGLSASF